MASIEWSSLVLSVGVGAVAALLAAWQAYERSRRPEGLPADDLEHFAGQEFRRGLVASVMALLAVGIYVGSRLPLRIGGRPNWFYVGTWLALFGLVILLLVLALVDWVATRRYAVRHRRAIVKEGLEILRDHYQSRRDGGASLPPTGGANGAAPAP